MKRTLPFVFALVLVAGACGGTEEPTAAESGSTTTVATTSAPTTAVAATSTSVADTTHVDDDHSEDAHEEDSHEGDSHDDDEGHGEEPAVSETIPEGARLVEVSMTEMAFDPASVEVMAGETIVFRVTNVGVLEHEFRLSNAHRIEEHLESHDDGGHDDGGGHHEDADIVLVLGAGEVGDVTAVFPDDTTVYTEVACLLPGHYEAGMKGVIAYM